MSSPPRKSALVNAIESYLEEYSWDLSLPKKKPEVLEMPSPVTNDCAVGTIIAFKARG